MVRIADAQRQLDGFADGIRRIATETGDINIAERIGLGPLKNELHGLEGQLSTAQDAVQQFAEAADIPIPSDNLRDLNAQISALAPSTSEPTAALGALDIAIASVNETIRQQAMAAIPHDELDRSLVAMQEKYN